MKQNKKQEIALMKYQIIAPLVSGLVESASNTDFFREASEKGFKSTDGTIKHFAPSTIERWFYTYRSKGFNCLIPNGRVDCGMSRKLDDDVKSQIKHYRTCYPRLSATAIYNDLLDKGVITKDRVSLSTVTRYIKCISDNVKFTKNIDMRRYEREHINEVWCGDTCTALWIKPDNVKNKQRVFVIALIDDASRYIVDAQVFFNDTFVNLMQVLKSAVSKYGRPQILNFDNGSSYKNCQMELLAARIGTTLHYDHPYSPTQKAKIERWFRTMKDQWVATINPNNYHSLDALQQSLNAYVLKYNNATHASLNGKSPKDRYFSEPNLFKRLPNSVLDQAFLLEITRKVSADSIISIDQVEYEVSYKYARQRITLRYSPDLKNFFIVNTDGSLSPIKLLNKIENSKIKREKTYLSEGDDLVWTIPQD